MKVAFRIGKFGNPHLASFLVSRKQVLATEKALGSTSTTEQRVGFTSLNAL